MNALIFMVPLTAWQICVLPSLFPFYLSPEWNNVLWTESVGDGKSDRLQPGKSTSENAKQSNYWRVKHESERGNKTKWNEKRKSHFNYKPKHQKAEKCNSKAVTLKKAWNLQIYLEADKKTAQKTTEFNCSVKEVSSSGRVYTHPARNSAGKHSVLE